jgi:outer membrane protein OmpA-like peptidoglycan-associated protein
MTRRLATWVLVGGITTTGSALAQDTTAPPNSVKKEDVKTWVVTSNGKDYEARPLTPSYDGSTGLFHMSSAFSLPKGKFSFQLFRDNLDRDPKNIDASIHGLSLGYGAGRGLEIFGNIGLQNRNNVDSLSHLGFANDYPFAGNQTTSPGWQTGFGDIKLGVKYQFLRGWSGGATPGGLAARGYVKLPTADDEKGLGTGKASFGADLIASFSLGNVVGVHGSLGYQFNSDPDSVDIGNAFKWAIGANLPCCRVFQVQAELMGTNYGDSDFSDASNPLDLVVGPVFWIKTGWFIRPAISWNLNFDDRGDNSSSSSWTGRQISIGYHPGETCREVYVPPPPPPPPSNRPPTVACATDRSSVIPGETVRCRATASDPDGDPLTYEWSASAGKVTGTGAEVTFDSAGVAPSTVTVTVKVSDGRGGTASATCTIRVDEPRKPETITCTSGGFPRNLSRLNNVDKACLDDVATRLRQDPKARVVIVGHADSKERYPEVIGRTRAEAVKNYLVKDRGIEESRITAKSAGATRPLDTGTSAAARAKNRRVELIFVPEGATAPEDDD